MQKERKGLGSLLKSGFYWSRFLSSTFIYAIILFIVEKSTEHKVTELLLGWFHISHGTDIGIVVSIVCVSAGALLGGALTHFALFLWQAHHGKHKTIILWLTDSELRAAVGDSSAYADSPDSKLAPLLIRLLKPHSPDLSSQDIQRMVLSFRAVVQGGGRIPPELIEQLRLLYATGAASPSLEGLLKIVLDTHSAAAGVPDSLSQVISDRVKAGAVPKVGDILAHYVETEIQLILKRVGELSQEGRKPGTKRWVEVPHKWAQMDVAASVAHWHARKLEGAGKEKHVFSAHATSFDAPSNLYDSYGRDYFSIQAAFAHFGDPQAFNTYRRRELELCISYLKRAGKPPAARDLPVPDKARVVLIDLDLLKGEFSHEARKFESLMKFIGWHIDHAFALRFIIIQEAWKDLGVQGYREDLRMVTEEEDDFSIDDFIVYNRSTVFGRTNTIQDKLTGPPSTEVVPIRLEWNAPNGAGERIAIKYDRFFEENLWKKPEARSPSELVEHLHAKGEILEPAVNEFFKEYLVVLNK